MSPATDTELLDLISLGRPVKVVVPWLESALMSPRLPEVADGLRWLLGPPGQPTSLPVVLGEYYSGVLAEGLGSLPPERLNALLRHPELLGELQDELLLAESPYWDGLLQQLVPELPPLVAAAGHLPALATADAAPNVTSSPPVASTTRGAGPSAVRTGWLAAVAAAAAVWGAVVYWPGETRWGWQRPEVLNAQVSGPEYLRLLRDQAPEVPGDNVKSPAELDRWLNRVLVACQALKEAPHPQLSEDDRLWLQERCGKWIEKLEKQRESLRSVDVDTLAFNQIRADSFQIIRDLREALNKRADQLSASV